VEKRKELTDWARRAARECTCSPAAVPSMIVPPLKGCAISTHFSPLRVDVRLEANTHPDWDLTLCATDSTSIV
jgi:hypothetical protein